MKKIILSLIAVLLITTLSAQADDSFDELEGIFNFYFVDAQNGKPLEGGEVIFEEIGDFTTDKNGKISVEFEDTEDKFYKITFAKAGYIKVGFDVEMQAGTFIKNQFSVSKKLQDEDLRIVLEWGKNPKDLDAHLVKKGGYHISYRNMKKAGENALLDIDDTKSYGPETITVFHLDKKGKYEFYIQDYTNKNNKKSKKLSKSKAIVRVYSQSGLIETFETPKKKKGTIWEVFEIKNGAIKSVNKIK